MGGSDGRIVLWGAGAMALRFLSTMGTDGIVGIVDSDPRKWGTRLVGLEVREPSGLEAGSFDAIYICSAFPRSVRSSIAEIPSLRTARVVVPPKWQFFADTDLRQSDVRSAARSALATLQQRLAHRDVPLIAILGTALGIVREMDLIPWDSDIDIAVEATTMREVEQVLHALQWPIDRPSERPGQSMQFRMPTTPGREIRAGVLPLDFDGPTVAMPAFEGALVFPARMFREPEWASWREGEFLVPGRPEEYLEHVYGEDWRIPRQDFTLEDHGYDIHPAWEGP